MCRLSATGAQLHACSGAANAISQQKILIMAPRAHIISSGYLINGRSSLINGLLTRCCCRRCATAAAADDDDDVVVVRICSIIKLLYAVHVLLVQAWLTLSMRTSYNEPERANDSAFICTKIHEMIIF